LTEAPYLRADGRQRGTRRARDVVALAAAVMLVDQVDLQVADVGALAQVVLPHQAVEVDRRRGAGVALHAGDFRQLADFRGEFAQHPVGGFQRAALRHVEHHLELALVVEGQHLQHHQFDHRQAGRAGHQQQHRGEQQQTPARGLRAFEEGAHDAVEQALQPGLGLVGRCFAMRSIKSLGVMADQLQRQPRRDDQRY
jgi:hypothetical protein